MPDFNVSEVRRDLLVTLRGPLSQAQLNSRLGFKSNQIYRWESGQAVISWADFCRLCDAVSAPLADACREKFGFNGEPSDFVSLIRHLAGPRRPAELAHLFGVSSSVISRWKSGESEPSLEQVLFLMEQSAHSHFGFLLHLTEGREFASIRKELEMQRRERELHYDRPWIAMLLLCLITEEYKALAAHDDDFVAKRIGVSTAQVRKAMKDLLGLECVSLNKKHYEPRLRRLNVIGDRQGEKRIREYWTKRCLGALQFDASISGKVVWPYMVFNTNSEAFEKIRLQLLDLYEQIQISSQEDTGSNGLYIFNAQLFPVGDLPPDSGT